MTMPLLVEGWTVGDALEGEADLLVAEVGVDEEPELEEEQTSLAVTVNWVETGWNG